MENTLIDIRKTVVLHASIEKVWRAVSSSEGIAAWFMPNTFEPNVGEEFILHAGPYGDSPCKVTEMDPPNKLEFDWDKDWHITFELKKLEDNKTEFTLIHSGWDAEKSTKFGQPHPVVRDIMAQGWDKIVKKALPSYIEG